MLFWPMPLNGLIDLTLLLLPNTRLYLAAAKLISGLDRWDQRDDQCCPLPYCQGHTWFITQHKFCSNFYNTSARKLRCQAYYVCASMCVCEAKTGCVCVYEQITKAKHKYVAPKWQQILLLLQLQHRHRFQP